jgi:adenylate kinase family enzyme
MVAGRTKDFARILILGNSGSGKSWLSRELGERLKIAAIDLDTVHWELEGFQVARDKDSARAIVRQIASQDIWIMEGVYGWLAQEILSRATALIWLDMPLEDCLDNLRRRGLNPGSDEKSFAALLAWTATNQERQTSSSSVGHRRLFTAFRGWKRCMCSRQETREFLAGIKRA